MSVTQAYYARWRALEERKAEIQEDLKELFAEAKGAGYEAKALREAFRREAREAALDENAAKRQQADEHEALVETYRADLARDAHVRERAA